MTTSNKELLDRCTRIETKISKLMLASGVDPRGDNEDRILLVNGNELRIADLSVSIGELHAFVVHHGLASGNVPIMIDDRQIGWLIGAW